MYVSWKVIVSLLLLLLLYMICSVLFWPVIGLYTMFFSLMPLVAFVCMFDSPVLNYFNIFGCNLLILYILKQPIAELLYQGNFWAIQSTVLLIAVFISVIKSRFPKRPWLVGQNINQILKKKYDKTVYIDPVLKTIQSISKSATKIYGWSGKNMINQPVGIIHRTDIWECPPHNFWENLEQKGRWFGFIEIINKNNIICEESAYYNAIKDYTGKIILIEKKIVDVFIKDKNTNKIDMFYRFYENSNQSMAIINRDFYIENANPAFIKNSISKPVLLNTIFSDMFQENIREKIICAVTEAFNGSENSFNGSFVGINGTHLAEFSFIPYYCDQYKKITHVLFIQSTISECLGNKAEIESDAVITSEIKVELFGMLQKLITNLYQNNPSAILKLYGIGLKGILITNQWYDILSNLLFYIYTEKKECNIIIVSSNDFLINKSIIFSLLGISYHNLDAVKRDPKFQYICQQIFAVGSDIQFQEGKQKELCFFVSI